MSAWRLLERYLERDRGLADVPWEPLGPDAWGKSRGNLRAMVQLNAKGDGSFIVTSVLDRGTGESRQQIPCANHQQAIARAEAEKLRIDSRAV